MCFVCSKTDKRYIRSVGMIVNANVLVSGLCVFLIIMIVVILVSLFQSEKKEATFQEPVTIALVQDPRTFEEIQKQNQTQPIVHVETKRHTFDKVAIPTDAYIDAALQHVAQKADQRYEEFVSADTLTSPSTLATAAAASTLITKFVDASNYIDETAKKEINKDHIGDDIYCLRDGSGPNICSTKCNADPKCLGFSYTAPNDKLPKGGCCYKTKALPLVTTQGTDFYTIQASKTGTIAQKALDTANTLAKTNAANAAKKISDSLPKPTTSLMRNIGTSSVEAAALQAKKEQSLAYTDATATKKTFADHIGNDIQCLNDGSGPNTCSIKCNANAKCRGFNYHSPDAKFPKGGCCYKSSASPLTMIPSTQPEVDFYTILAKANGTIAQRSIQQEIDAAQALQAKYAANNRYTNPQYTKSVGRDHVGDNMQPISSVHGSIVADCAKKCDEKNNCAGFNYIHNTVSGHSLGTCTFKTKGAPLSDAKDTDFFFKMATSIGSGSGSARSSGSGAGTGSARSSGSGTGSARSSGSGAGTGSGSARISGSGTGSARSLGSGSSSGSGSGSGFGTGSARSSGSGTGSARSSGSGYGFGSGSNRSSGSGSARSSSGVGSGFTSTLL